MSGAVKLERVGAVATVTLDRPDRRNAMNREMWQKLGAVAEQLAAELPRAVVLTGAGGAFCAGMDVNPDNPHVSGIIQAVQGRERGPVEAMLRELHDVLDRLFGLPVPIIAAVEGLAYGGGAELCARCDLRVAAKDAVFCFSEVKLGLMPDWGGGASLARLVGPGRAAHLVLTARKVGTEEALGLGLVNEVVPAGGARAAGEALAAQIAANGPRAVRAALRVVRSAGDGTLADAVAHELDLAVDLIASGECVHGITAFMTRTPPTFPDPE